MPTSLDDRVEKLEHKMTAAIAIAIVLGLGGAGISFLLKDAYNQINDLHNQLNPLEEAKQTAISSVKASAKAATDDMLHNVEQKYVLKDRPLRIYFRPAENLCLFFYGGNGGQAVSGDCGNNNHTVITINPP